MIRRRTSDKVTNQRGDTLVEVAIAIAVLGLTLAATVTVINRSLLTIMNSVDQTSIRGKVNSQVEMLRYVFDTQDTANRKLAQQILLKTDGNGGIADRGCAAGGNAFYLKDGDSIDKPITMTNYPASTNVAQTLEDNNVYTPEPGQGIWVEGNYTAEAGDMPGYVDFYVRSCWTPFTSKEVGLGRIESTVRIQIKKNAMDEARKAGS